MEGVPGTGGRVPFPSITLTPVPAPALVPGPGKGKDCLGATCSACLQAKGLFFFRGPEPGPGTIPALCLGLTSCCAHRRVCDIGDSNPGWLHARRAPYLLCCLSSPSLFF